MDEPCCCGHSVEEHGGNEKYPGSTACYAKDCDCVAYDADYESDPDEGQAKP